MFFGGHGEYGGLDSELDAEPQSEERWPEITLLGGRAIEAPMEYFSNGAIKIKISGFISALAGK